MPQPAENLPQGSPRRSARAETWSKLVTVETLPFMVPHELLPVPALPGSSLLTRQFFTRTHPTSGGSGRPYCKRRLRNLGTPIERRRLSRPVLPEGRQV